MKKCPYCGQTVENDVSHCPKCLAGFPHETEQKNEESEEVEKGMPRRKRIPMNK